MGFREKRGGSLVEAALIYPIILLSVLTAIWLLITLYEQTVLRSSIHLALRESAGIASGTVLPPDEAGFNGLYSNLFEQQRLEELITERANKRIESGGLPPGNRITVEGKNQVAVVPVLKLVFNREKRGWGLYGKGIQDEKTCWYFNIDEAQWVTNEQWLREEVKR